ncbi:sigma-70 family RNA polymerase sigma factor [Cryomorphaceae bacterium 1068]|nr:sigma-70 family RNA polymerase sigma factor [Cryomorphaceae bacterium 1068]
MEDVVSKLSPKAQHDYKLVRRAVDDQDQAAYAELMERYRESIYYMLLKMVNNPDDADDLTIEAFGKAFSRLKQYQPNYAFSTWMFKIASNNCIDFIRKERKKRTMSIDTGLRNEDGDNVTYDIQSDVRDPEEEMVRDQRMAAMRQVVDKLKPRYKQLVILRYFKEYSYDEIAQELDLPLGTVKAQLFRARDFLSTMMKNTKDTI